MVPTSFDKPFRTPEVLTQKEIKSLISKMIGTTRLFAGLLYGSGMRFAECLHLRVKDLDFDNREIIVRNDRGEKNHITILPICLVDELQAHLRGLRERYLKEHNGGLSSIDLPYALVYKYPFTQKDWNWQYIFPYLDNSSFPQNSKRMKGNEKFLSFKTILQREIRNAARNAGIKKNVSPNTLRRSFAVQLLRNGYDIRVVQKLSAVAFRSLISFTRAAFSSLSFGDFGRLIHHLLRTCTGARVSLSLEHFLFHRAFSFTLALNYVPAILLIV